MPATPFWSDDSLASHAWDFCWLGENNLPGICKVEVEGGRDVDAQKSKGEEGRALKDEGTDGAKIDIECRMWLPQHHEQWDITQRAIDPLLVNSVKTPFEIHHPACDERGVRYVYITSLSCSHPESGGVRTAHITAQQWFPQPKKTKTSKTVKAKQAQIVKDAESIPDYLSFAGI